MAIAPADELKDLQRDYFRRIDPVIDYAMAYGAAKKQALDLDRLTAFDADDQRRRPNYTFVPGDRVVFTGKALNSMGVQHGEAVAHVWTTLECACGLCLSARFVCTDQALLDGSGWRHIACAALRLEHQSSVDDIDNMPMLEASKLRLGAGVTDAIRSGRAKSAPWTTPPDMTPAPGSLGVLLGQLEEFELGRKERRI